MTLTYIFLAIALVSLLNVNEKENNLVHNFILSLLFFGVAYILFWGAILVYALLSDHVTGDQMLIFAILLVGVVTLEIVERKTHFLKRFFSSRSPKRLSFPVISPFYFVSVASAVALSSLALIFISLTV